MSYELVDGGAVRVTARSSVHDTCTTWSRMTGRVDVDREQLESAVAYITVDMTQFDAGDWLKNRKLKKDLAVTEHPIAEFELRKLSDARVSGDDIAATAVGVIRWRGRELAVTATGSGTLTDTALTASATFDLNVRDFGITPPRFLMLKVEDVVRVDVRVIARRDS